MVQVDARLTQGLQQLFAEEIVPHAAHHRHLGPQPGALEGLVGPLSAGGHVKLSAIDRLAGGGDPLCGGDHIHDKAAYC